MPTSLFAEDGMVDVITHIHTISNPAKLDPFTIELIPFILPLPIKEKYAKDYVRTVDYDHGIIVTNQDQSVAYEIDQSQMDECTLLKLHIIVNKS